jgi:type IV pilus assembly protein PilM
LNLKRSINLRNDAILGLDIGSSAVKVVSLQKNDEGFSATGIGICEIAASQEDDHHRRKNTILAIRECLEQVKIKTKLVVCSVSGPEVAVRDFEFPPLSAEDIEAAVQLEASQVCPLNVADSTVDYHLIPNGDNKTRGILVAATNNLITSKVQLAKEARLNCILMDVDGLALLNCFNELEKPQKDHGTAILNIGSSNTTFAVEGDDGSPFIRNLSYAGDNIIEGIAAENEMTPEAVRAMFSGETKEIPPNIQDSFGRACNRLINEINKTVRYYAAQERSSDIRKILVCGGFAMFGELVKILDDNLPMDVELWNPFEKMRCYVGRNHRGALVKNIVRKHGPALAVAAGLAMRTI